MPTNKQAPQISPADLTEARRLLTILQARHQQPIDSAIWLLTAAISSMAIQQCRDLTPRFMSFISESLSDTSLVRYIKDLSFFSYFYSDSVSKQNDLMDRIDQLIRKNSPDLPTLEKFNIYKEVCKNFLDIVISIDLKKISAGQKRFQDFFSKFEKSHSNVMDCFMGGLKKAQHPASIILEYVDCLRKSNISIDIDMELLKSLDTSRRHRSYLLYFNNLYVDSIDLLNKVKKSDPKGIALALPFPQDLPNNPFLLSDEKIKKLYNEATTLPEFSEFILKQKKFQSEIDTIIQIVFTLVTHLILIVPLSFLFSLFEQKIHSAFESTELRKLKQDFLALQTDGGNTINFAHLLADLKRIEANPNIAERFMAYWPFIQVLMIAFTALMLYCPELFASYSLLVYFMQFILPIAFQSIPSAAKYLYKKGYQNPRISSDADNVIKALNQLHTGLPFSRSIDKAGSWEDVFIQVVVDKKNSDKLQALDDTCISSGVALIPVVSKDRSSHIYLLQAKDLQFFNRWGSIDAAKVKKFKDQFEENLRLITERKKAIKADRRHLAAEKTISTTIPTPSAEHLVAASTHTEYPSAEGLLKRRSKKTLAPEAPKLPVEPMREEDATRPRYTWVIENETVNSNAPNVYAIPGNFQNPLYIMGCIDKAEFEQYAPLLFDRYNDLLENPHMANARRATTGIVWEDKVLKMKFIGAMGDYRIISELPIDSQDKKAKLFIFSKIGSH